MKFPHLDKELFKNIFEADDWYDRLLDFVAQDEAERMNISSEQVKKILNNTIMLQREDLNNAVNEASIELNRIACLTIKKDNLPMWTHYAKQHTGVCIEYDTSNIQNALTINRLFPVRYQNNFMDAISYMMRNNDKKFTFFDNIAIHKLKDWEYEQEWRLLLNKGQLFDSPEQVPMELKKTRSAILFYNTIKSNHGL